MAPEIGAFFQLPYGAFFLNARYNMASPRRGALPAVSRVQLGYAWEFRH
jgi:hypothetical protein